MTTGERPLTDQLISSEISGKNAAIHAYDSIIWKIRSGFLTLLFAGWGIILSGLVEKSATVNLEKAKPFVLMMLVVSIGLAVGGATIDINYVRRKFRVIHDLNKLLGMSLQLEEGQTDVQRADLRSAIRVSGDSGDDSYKIAGYRSAVSVLLPVYLLPIVFLSAGLWLILFQ